MSDQLPARFHSRAALHLLMLAIEADARGDVEPWRRANVGTLDRAYCRFLGESLLRLVRKPLPKARYELRQFAERLKRGRGRDAWSGAHRDFAAQLADSVVALAVQLPRKPRGNPDWVSGRGNNLAQRRVNASFDELKALYDSRNDWDWDWETELRVPGTPREPSRLRGLIVRHALKRAREEDDLYAPPENVRARIKSDRRAARRRARRQMSDE